MDRLKKVLAVWLLLLTPAGHALDIVTFGDGNQLLGEVKYLERGRLYFKTDATGTIPIEWDDVTRLTSDQLLRLELVDGTRQFGALGLSAEDSGPLVRMAGSETTLSLAEVVSIQPIEEKFWDRFSGTLSAGYNFTKANEVTQFNLGTRLQYLTSTWRSNLDLSSNITKDSSSATSNRSSIDVNTRRLRGKHWATGAFLTFERNDALGLDLRSSIGTQVERYLRNDNRQRFWVTAGLLVSQEEQSDSSKAVESVESLFSVNYELFRYDEPEIDLSTGFSVLPNLTDFGRVRSEFDITLKWELYKDLFWQLSFENSYDSRPPTADASENDYVVVTGLAWDL